MPITIFSGYSNTSAVWIAKCELRLQKRRLLFFSACVCEHLVLVSFLIGLAKSAFKSSVTCTAASVATVLIMNISM